ncbi:hypothetical protein [Dactylosporangium sp. CA-233914]|uniref:hypothetical protein n=1 Tax=Dactylosporangium sp. CA-233914 TaxID=3239934 RepID=UPI003D9487A0
MRYVRAVLTAAAVGVCGLLAVWAGHIGAAGFWRAALMAGVAMFACVALAVVVPLIGFDDGEAGCGLLFPAFILVAATTWLTTVDIEVRSGQWRDVVVMDNKCVANDSGCSWQFRVSDARTEQDLGWIGCDAEPWPGRGDRTRVRTDPAGAHKPSLEACAHTSHGWTIALRCVYGVWLLIMIGGFWGAVAVLD